VKGIHKLMTDLVTVAVIGAVAAGFSSVMQFITVTKVNQIQATADRNEQHAKKTADVVTKTQSDVNDLKAQTNGFTETLLKVTGEAEHAKGKLEGIAEEKKTNSNTKEPPA
jgi:hypothetical protein